MATAREFQKKLQPLLNETLLANRVAEIILRDSGGLLKSAKIDEFKRGVLPDGSRIGTYRNPDYAYRKSILNPMAGRGYVDLILTGRFSRSGKLIRVATKAYRFEFNDPNSLIERYGEENEGLNANTFNVHQKEKVWPEIVEYIRRQLGQV